jgi:hypothetical protein
MFDALGHEGSRLADLRLGRRPAEAEPDGLQRTGAILPHRLQDL